MPRQRAIIQTQDALDDALQFTRNVKLALVAAELAIAGPVIRELNFEEFFEIADGPGDAHGGQLWRRFHYVHALSLIHI